MNSNEGVDERECQSNGVEKASFKTTNPYPENRLPSVRVFFDAFFVLTVVQVHLRGSGRRAQDSGCLGRSEGQTGLPRTAGEAEHQGPRNRMHQRSVVPRMDWARRSKEWRKRRTENELKLRA